MATDIRKRVEDAVFDLAKEDPAAALAISADLAEAFCEANGLQQFSDAYPDNLKHPKSTLAQPAAEESAKGADVAKPKRRPYNASASLSEYGIFPECDAAPAAQTPRACTCHPDDRPDGPCRERYAASECQALAAQAPAANADALLDALRQIAEWPDGGNLYGQGKIKRFAQHAIDAAMRKESRQ